MMSRSVALSQLSRDFLYLAHHSERGLFSNRVPGFDPQYSGNFVLAVRAFDGSAAKVWVAEKSSKASRKKS
jgi:hypothetical protein